MIKDKKTEKLALIVITVLLIGSLVLQSVQSQNTPTSAAFTEYSEALFGDEIITLEILVDQSKWDEMIANAQAKTYIMADVVVNGVTYQNVGVRTKGNASLSQVSQSGSPERYSLRIKFGEYIDGQTCLGLDELVLNNMISDPSYMKEYLSQELMRFIGVEAPLTNYASLSVNGEGIGFYVALESYGESFDRRVFGDSAGEYYNVKTMEMGGGMQNRGQGGFAFGQQQNQADEQAPDTNDWQDRQGFVGQGGGSRGGSLEYTDDDLESYPAIFENALGNVSSSKKQRVVTALKALDDGTDLESYFDMDQVIRYFAAHTFLVSMDSYYSNMAQNYVIQERDGVISILPWDYHLSYGGFQSGTASQIVNAPIDTPLSGVTLESRPLLNAVLSNETYLGLYHQYLQQIVTDYFGSGLFEETVRNLQTKISTYVENDPTAFTSFDEFNQAVDTLIAFNFLRAESITGQLDGSIPATTEGQTSSSSALIDASGINMADLGSMGGGGNRSQMPQGNMGEMPDREEGNLPGGWNPEGGQAGGQNQQGWAMPDQQLMRQAMEIVQAAGGELTDSVKEQLLALGITEEQISFFEQMSGGFFPGGSPEDQNNPPDGEALPGQTAPQDGQTLPEANQLPNAQPGQTGSSAAVSIPGVASSYAVQLGILGGILAIAILLVVRFKRSY